MNYLPLYSRYIGGWDVRSVLRTVERCAQQGMQPILDYVREDSKNDDDAMAYCDMMKEIGSHMRDKAFALKLSGFRNLDMVLPLSTTLMKNNHVVMLDAERVDTYDLISDMANTAMYKFNKSSPVFYKTYQMYRKDALQELAKDMALTRKRNFILGVKLVRGAYYHQDSSSGLLYTTMEDTHASYHEAVKMVMWDMARNERVRPIFATHNKDSIEFIQKLALALYVSNKQYEFAQLLGLADSSSIALVKKNYRVRKYIPFGKVCESVPYLIRRLHENPEVLRHF